MGEPGERGERKERVIHTRVAEDLDAEIKRRAQRLGVSVSNLVRNVLQNTIDLVDDIVQEGAESLRAVGGEPRAPGRGPRPAGPHGGAARREPELLGWQHMVLAVNAVCERCNAILPRGGRGAIGVTDPPGPRRFRCERCATEEASDAGADPEPR